MNKYQQKSIVFFQGALRFYAQNVDDGPKLEKLTSELREHLKNNEPVPGAYNARRGDLCAAVFSLDGQVNILPSGLQILRIGQIKL